MKHRSSTVSIFVLFVWMVLGVQVWGQAQNCYVRLEDASGINTDAYQSELQAAAAELCAIFDSAGFEGQFKVYDFGFYLHQSTMQTTFPSVFQKKNQEVEATTPYYLIFGKQTDPTGIYTKLWVKLKLPDNFLCIDEFRGQILNNNLNDLIEEEYANNYSFPSFFTVEITAMNYLKSFFNKSIECCICCDVANRSLEEGCSLCPSEEEIMKVLISKHFIGMPANIQEYTSITTNGMPNIVNYANSTIKNIDLLSRVTTILSDLPDSCVSKVYITDNSSVCPNTYFSLVDSLYNINKSDCDVWIHLWNSGQEGIDDVVFVNFEYYILADDENFVNDIEENEGVARPNKSSAGSIFLIVDPIKDEIFFSSEPIMLNNEGLPSSDPTVEKPVIVVKPNENLSIIANNSNGAFTVDDLLHWNPSITNPDLILPGDELNIFVEEYQRMIEDEAKYVPLHVPFNGRLDEYNFSISHQDLTPHLGGLLSVKPNVIVSPGEVIKQLPLPPAEVPDNYSPPSPSTPGWQQWTRYLLNGRVMLTSVLVLMPGSLANDTPILVYEQKQFENLWVDQESDSHKALLYVTYTKSNMAIQNKSPLKPGKVYVGRTRGVGTPKVIVAVRDRGADHRRMTVQEGFGSACVDKALFATETFEKRRGEESTGNGGDISYQYIRGREQDIMEKLGGAWSSIPNNAQDETRSRNKINGIDKKKYPAFYWRCVGLARLFSSSIDINWDGVCPHP